MFLKYFWLLLENIILAVIAWMMLENTNNVFEASTISLLLLIFLSILSVRADYGFSFAKFFTIWLTDKAQTQEEKLLIKVEEEKINNHEKMEIVRGAFRIIIFLIVIFHFFRLI